MSVSASPLGLGVGPPMGSSGPLNGPPPSSDQLLLTLRNKPHCRVFRALFQYLPLRDSPNDNPQLELPLNPGDVVLVRGEMDSDGFFRGETLDGRTGLVPSNYVERVPDHLILQNARAPSPSFPLTVPPHLTAIQHDFTTEPDASPLPDSVCPFPPADVSKVTVQEIKPNDSPRVPCPRDLVVEKKLSRSVVISWSPPEESFVVVSQYHVCVDGVVRSLVPGSYKCRALIEDVALDHSVNVSVRAVTDQGHSSDQACSIAVGNEAQVAPQHLRVWQVTPVSACVRWHPSNSNAEHVVSLNAVKVGVCPPSVFQVQLAGLTPSTIYRVSIRTKHPRAVLEQRPVERCLDFKTLPKIGLPDPPSNVQVEHGPQPGHLLVSWTPVCTQPKPPSRAAVAGYLIYADGKNIAQVPSETVIADHAVLRLADLSDDPPIFITVRTKTKEGAVSADSNVARVPRGPYSEPLLTAAPLTLDPMASSYPSYAQPAYGTPNPYIGPLSGPAATSTAVQQLPGFWNPAETTAAPPVVPYTAPALMNAMPFQVNPLTTYGAASAIQGYSTAPTYDGTLPRMGTLTRGAGLATATAIPAQPTTLQTTLPPSHTATLQGTLPKWKTPQSMSQYYTFHPRLLRADGTADDARPSVLEMENSYLLRHRQNEWTGPSAAVDGRTRAEIYARGGGIRAGSAEERLPGGASRGRLVPPRLARVRSETGFGTRSEPDLRPPTLDDDCRWFVALFDYSHHMSPNANAEAEELSFRKHQLIKVYGEADGDGFYQGQIGNRYGLVPSNMVIEIAKTDLLPPYKTTLNRGEPMLAAEQPALRRMRWGSLKSRSYDHAGDRRRETERPGAMYSSLDRREMDRREPPPRDRYRRANGRDYEYRRDYDDRYREGSRDRREDYYREEEDYRDREKYRYESRERRDERREERRDDRRDYEERRRREDDRYRRDRRDEGYREDRSFDYADKRTTGYDQGPGRPPSQLGHMAGPSAATTYGAAPPLTSQMSLGQLTQQMGQIHLQQGMGMQHETRMNGVHAQQPTRHMVAKFDYDSRQLSPNADAEQTELSFKQGDLIAIYGDMDEDGFYVGELNGLKGLVPSNFLSDEAPSHLMPSVPAEQQMMMMQQRKGVAFSDGQMPLPSQPIPTAAPVKKAPTRQSSQTSTTPAVANNVSAATKPTAKKSTAGQGTGAKALAKKTSDVGKKDGSTPAVRKTSTAVKKSDSTAKKK